MMEEQENRFLVMVIHDLLNLWEITKGKNNKDIPNYNSRKYEGLSTSAIVLKSELMYAPMLGNGSEL